MNAPRPEDNDLPMFALPHHHDGPPQLTEAMPPHRLFFSLQGRVNHALQNESVVDSDGYLAPVAPLVWEAVFESKDFMPEKGER